MTAPALTVSPSGAVTARSRSGEMRVEGEIAGEFDADVVQLSGKVKDNTVIRAKTLEVKLTPPSGKMQVIFGECELEVGESSPPRRRKNPKAARRTRAAIATRWFHRPKAASRNRSIADWSRSSV